MTFTYEALDRAGNVVRDTIDARSLSDAREALRGRGLFVNTCDAETPHSARARTARAERYTTNTRGVLEG